MVMLRTLHVKSRGKLKGVNTDLRKSYLGLEYLDKKRSGKKATPTGLGSAALPLLSLQWPVLAVSGDQL